MNSALGLFLVFEMGEVPPNRPFEVRGCVIGETFDEEQQEVESVVVDLFYVALELVLIALLQLFLDEPHLLQSPAGQTAQAVQDVAAAGGLDVESDLTREQSLQTDQVVVLDAQLQGGLSEVVLLVAVQLLFVDEHGDQFLRDPVELVSDLSDTQVGFLFTRLYVLFLANLTDQMKITVASASLLVIDVRHHLLLNVPQALHVLGSPPNVLQRKVKGVLQKLKGLVWLEQFSRTQMTLVDGQFPGVEALLILSLFLPIAEDHDGFDVSIGSSIVQEGVLAGVHFLESAPVLD